MSAPPKVAVILINRNAYDLTEACVRSLLATGYPNLLIVVTDNGSRREDLDRLTKLADKETSVLVHPLGYNAGFTKANNAGMELAMRNHNPDYLWILNNDTEVRKDAIDLFLRAFAEGNLDPAETLLSCIMTYFDNDNVWCNGLRDLPLANFPKSVDKGLPAAQIARPGIVLKKSQYSVGCSMFLSKEFVRRHGLMNEEFFIYFDDLDFSLNRNNVYLQQPLVRHKVSSTAGVKGSTRYTPFQAFLFAQNGTHFYFRKKKIPFHERIVYLCFTTWVFLLLYVRDWRTLKAHFRGLCSGVTNGPEKNASAPQV